MAILKVVGSIYLIIGFFYALYVFAKGRDFWYNFPINMAAGPMWIIYIAVKVRKEKLNKL